MIVILCFCLGLEFVKLIEGISFDLKVVWKYLDYNYGDLRVIFDIIIVDIERFKLIQFGEDYCFCDFVNLIRWLFNILKEVKCLQDFDNIYVIFFIERKLIRDDLKVWVRYINN